MKQKWPAHLLTEANRPDFKPFKPEGLDRVAPYQKL